MRFSRAIFVGLFAVLMLTGTSSAVSIPSGKISNIWIGYVSGSVPAAFTFSIAGKTYFVYAADFGTDNYKSTLALLISAFQNGYTVVGDYNVTNSQNRVWDVLISQ